MVLLVDPLRRGHISGLDIAQFLATLRGRMEQDLIMLRCSDLDTSGDGIAPRQLVESMAERQVNALLHAAARTWPPGTLPALRSWALALARHPQHTKHPALW